MKKILITIFIILLCVLAYFAIADGIKLGNINVLSVKQIMDKNDELVAEIETTTTLLRTNYPSKKSTLSQSTKTLLEKKEEYLNLAKVSTESEINKANTEETYLIEHLWVKVGNHATSEGVNIKMDVNSNNSGEANMKNLSFTVRGGYIAIIDFIEDLENDSDLNFKIDNFKLQPNGTNLTATFNVKGIRIKTEKTSSIVSNNQIGEELEENTQSTTDREITNNEDDITNTAS